MDKQVFNDTLQSLQDALDYVNGDKTKGRSHIVMDKNSAYLAKVRRGIKQCAEGRGLVRELVEVSDDV